MTGNTYHPNKFGADGYAANSQLNVTGNTIIKSSPGRLCKIIINTAATTATNVYDDASETGIGASNLIMTIPANTVAGTVYDLYFPFQNGCVINVGTSGVLAVSYA